MKFKTLKNQIELATLSGRVVGLRSYFCSDATILNTLTDAEVAAIRSQWTNTSFSRCDAHSLATRAKLAQSEENE